MPPNPTHCSTPDSPLDSLTASLPFLFYFLLCFPISKVCFWANNCYNHPSSQPETTTICLSDLPTCHAELFFPFCISLIFFFAQPLVLQTHVCYCLESSLSISFLSFFFPILLLWMHVCNGWNSTDAYNYGKPYGR